MLVQRQQSRARPAGDDLTSISGARDSLLQAHSQAILLFIIATLALLASSTVHAAVTLESSSSLAEAGFYSLDWQDSEFENFELQEATDQAFAQVRTIYRGPDLATVISGRSNGEYFYRLRGVGADGTTGSWSEPIKVTVQHHPLSRALMFFAAGAVVFFAILFVILNGSRRQD